MNDIKREMDYQEAEEEGAKEAIETTKMLITKKCYRDARDCLKTVMEVYPAKDSLEEEDRFGMLVISETLYQGNIILPNCAAFDYYSVLHLPPSSSQAQITKRCNELKKVIIHLNNTIRFPGAMAAHSLLGLAGSLLCQKSMRSYFDSKRKDCVFLDWPQRQTKTTSSSSSSSSSSSFRESYLDWKPPVSRADSAHLHVEEEEEEEEEKNPSFTPELRILKRKVFDEMPQNPNYTPLVKYNKKIREGMILGLELAFTKLCEEIRNLVDVQSFWYGLDGFNEQISELKEMGFNVEKVKERIDVLKRIAECERASRTAAEKFEGEVRDQEAKVIKLQLCISKLQAEIKGSKVIITNRKSKIETLKKDLTDAVVEFASTANSKWA